ncbi:metalloregulator ArsR/SmtB family transcription factor [Dyella sp. ASV21]|uniref:helix-turn-helix transcriptional regulator n=1 Tax=Dyella sp. ASV21 TaxID=2795114 RepID=UPI0018EB53DD|nr:metalloregulator ArsR/SmtB family transcription factor [Dyella sp. ASV21]
MNLENKSEATAERILFQLKTVGPLSTATLAESLGLTAEAVRQQVQKLHESELIVGEAERGTGAGRPRQVWALTATGHARFPDTHAQLAVDLIGSVRQLFGDAGVDRLIDARREDNRQAYLDQLKNARSIGERVRRLAEIRQREGYMARAERDGSDWLLIEDHCPICAAARACQGFCRAELQLFQDVLGPQVRVEREQHLLAGARRCSYRVSPR